MKPPPSFCSVLFCSIHCSVHSQISKHSHRHRQNKAEITRTVNYNYCVFVRTSNKIVLCYTILEEKTILLIKRNVKTEENLNIKQVMRYREIK